MLYFVKFSLYGIVLHQNDFLLNYPYYMVLASGIKNINKETINSLFSTALINKPEICVIFAIKNNVLLTVQPTLEH